MSDQQPKLFKEKTKRIRTFSPGQVEEREFKELLISAIFQELLGLPSPNFCSIIHGIAKSGKSSFCLKLAQELAQFGKVLYISSEELISKSLQDRIRMNNIVHPRIRIAPVRSVDDIEHLVKRLHPKFIIIDSVQICGMKFKDFERLKNKVFKNRKSWHLISQTTNSGKMMLSQNWVHETDVKIKVEGGIVTAEGRFRPDGRMILFERRKGAPDLFNEAKPTATPSMQEA
jgi:predicted ATP-dependent serine protease